MWGEKMEKARDAVTALFGLAGFGLLGCVSPTIVGQALNTLLALGLIGVAYIVWTVWVIIANPIEMDRFKQEGEVEHGQNNCA